MATERTRVIAGCMAGTSMDGVDAAVVRVHGSGLDLRVTRLGFASVPFGDLAIRLRAIAVGEAVASRDWAGLARALGDMHARAVREALSDAALSPDERLELCAAHGQTLFHAPPGSFQLLNPWPIARELGCDVVHDLRGADLAAGGQGAPITPIADWVLFRNPNADRAVVNLGGFCNATFLRAGADIDAIRAMDVCACNHVLDGAARRVLDRPYDADGAQAAAGTPDATATGELAHILAAQSAEGRSLGSGDECAAWLDRHADHLVLTDLLASAAAGVGAAIARAISALMPDGEILLAGGGANNRALVRAIDDNTDARVRRSDDLGVAIQEREAIAMAILGALAADGVPITLPVVTGRTRAVASEGVWIRGDR